MFEYKEQYKYPINFCLNLTDSCNLACVYCVPAGTQILMADGTVKDIETINIGDLVIGTELETEPYKQKTIFPTKVLQLHHRTVDEYLKIYLQDGKILTLTPNHPVLNGRGKWTEAKNLREKTGIIMSLSYMPHYNLDILNNPDYIKGYFLAMWLTDGSFKYYNYDNNKYFRLRLAVKDTEIIERMKKYCNYLNFDYTTRDYLISEKEHLLTEGIFSAKEINYNYIINLKTHVQENINSYKNNPAFLRGFMAATYDAEGHIDKDGYVLSISNSDEFILDIWESGLQYFDFSYKRDAGAKPANKLVYRSRLLTSGYQNATGELQMKFFDLVKPAVSRKCFPAFYNSACLLRNKIKKIETINTPLEVYNIGTESHNYIANGLVVHNCFVQQKPHFMTLDIAKDAIDYIINNLNKRKELGTIDQEEKACVTFFGGEPTLLWDQIIVPVVQYVETTYPNQIDFTITTNGTLLNENRIDFLKKHDIYPLLSIDGDKEVQNHNRPQRNGEGSFDLVYKNIPYLLENFPMTTFRGTINQQMVSHLYESYKFAYMNGFRTIFLCPNARENWSEANLKILHQEIFKIYTDRIIHYLKGIKPINFALIDKAFEKILENDIQVYTSNYWQRSFSRNVMRCGLGTGSASISYDGKIFGCQEQDSRDTSDPFYIGDIYNGINPEKHIILLKKYNDQQEMQCEDKTLCENCILKNVCVEETCPSVSLDRYENFFIRPIADCKYHQALMEGASRSMDYLVNYEHNQLFKEYLDNLYKNYQKEEE